MMSSGLRWPRAGIAGAAAAAALATAAVAAASSAPNVPPKDRFKGTTSAATGKFTGDHGALALYLKPGRRAGLGRPVTIVLVGRRCRGAARCMDLTGRLRGVLTPQPAVSEAGRRFTISVTGKLSPIGRTSCTGTVTGTGFVMRGREELQITLSTSRGRITIAAESPIVPGFTSP